MRRATTPPILGLVTVAVLTGCSRDAAVTPQHAKARAPAARQKQPPDPAREMPRILFVDSYHPEFQWVADITEGLLDTFDIVQRPDGTLDTSRSPVDLRITHMDTKRNKDEAFKRQAALDVKKLIQRWKPDIVIAADDNASKYLIVPYYKNSDLPIVFCGINWDASIYGFPTANITGMVEVTMIPQAIEVLDMFAKGPRLGVIASDTLSERKNAASYRETFGIDFEEVYVSSYEAFTAEFLRLQQTCDRLIIGEIESIDGFDHDRMTSFVESHTSIPTGAIDSFLAPFVLVACAKTGQEQGEWAALRALEILAGRSPADIPIARNVRAKIYVNMRIARTLGIKLPMELLDRATFVH